MAFQPEKYIKQNTATYQREKAKEPVACDCWFTSKGEGLPRFFKYMDPEIGIISIPVTEVLYSEDKTWAGKKTRIFHCNSMLNGIVYHYQLLFFPDTTNWEVMWV